MRRAIAIAICAAALSTLAHDAEAFRPRSTRSWRPTWAADPLPLVLTSEAYYANLRLAVLPGYSTHAWQEPFISSAAIALTHPVADGDPVGQIDDPSQAAHIAQWGNARTGTLQTADDGRRYIECRSTGGTDIAVVQDSQSAFSFCTGGPRACTIKGFWGAPTDGAQQVMLDSIRLSGGSSSVGFSVVRTSANRVQLLIADGDGVLACNVTGSASATLLAADGIVPVTVRITGNAVQLNVGSHAEEGLTCAAAGVTTAMLDELTICGSSATTGNTDLDFGGLMIFDRVLTDAESAEIDADFTGRASTRSLVVERPAAEGYYNFLRTWYDFTDPDNIFSDSGATTPVELGDARVAVVRDPRDPTNTWLRQATSTVADAPTWQGSEGLEWTGAIPQALVWSAWSARGGARTVIVEALNRDADLSSHFLEGSNYAVMVGADYVGNPPSGAYFVVHPASGSVGQTTLVDPDGYNWMEIRRSGPDWTTSVSGTNTVQDTSSEGWSPTSIGRANDADLVMDGYQRRLLSYTARLSDAQLARVRNGMSGQSDFESVFPAAFLATLTSTGQAIVGREMTATGASSPWSVRGGPGDTRITTGGIVWNNNVENGCGACTAPTLTSDYPQWFQLVGGALGPTNTAGLFTGAFTDPASPLDFTTSAGFIVSTSNSQSDSGTGERGAILILAEGYNTGTFQPCSATNVWGYCFNTADDVSTGWRYCTDTDTCTNLGASAPRDDRRYYAALAVEAGATRGYALLIDLSVPGTPVIAHEATSVVLPASAFYGEINASTTGVTERTMRVDWIRGAEAYAPTMPPLGLLLAIVALVRRRRGRV